jgi:hypothetical protein
MHIKRQMAVDKKQKKHLCSFFIFAIIALESSKDFIMS